MPSPALVQRLAGSSRLSPASCWCGSTRSGGASSSATPTIRGCAGWPTPAPSSAGRASFRRPRPPHYVTLHSTLPVADHGMYEWFVYEPALDRMICPLMFSFAGDHERGTLAAAGVSHRAGLFPEVTPLMAGLADARRGMPRVPKRRLYPRRGHRPGAPWDRRPPVQRSASPGSRRSRAVLGSTRAAVCVCLPRHGRHRRASVAAPTRRSSMPRSSSCSTGWSSSAGETSTRA